MIAALYVAEGGCYFGLPDVDPWDEARDAAFPSALYVLDGSTHRRRPGDAVPTFAVCLRTLEVL